MEKQLINNSLLSEYLKKQRYSLDKHIAKLQKSSNDSFKFAFTRSSVFSSMLEGSSIDLDNYLFNKENEYVDDKMQQIDDLISAYEFAKNHALTFDNVLKVHKILSANFSISDNYKGKIRNQEVYIRTWLGKLVYEGCKVKNLKNELDLLFNDINRLKRNRKSFTIDEIFYYSAYVHLVFVNIHPFADGNGRLSRLIEKWLLSSLSEELDCWKIPSEINYYIKREDYHANLNFLGKKYDELDYEKALPFLLMLPTSFGISKKFTN